jgi:hypothetical protein
MYPETPSEDAVPLEDISVIPPFHKFVVDNQSVSDRDSQVTENTRPSRQSQASHQNEGVTSIEPLSQPVLVNVGRFASCHEEWPSHSPKVCTIWHINLP